jgi:GrpB-like predicted nucleotidyltransferase (UPF0157 family)
VGADPPRTSFADYDERYPAAFAALERRIRSVLPDVPVDHVGSTSVAGLGGRGVIDVVVVCPAAGQPGVVQALRGIGLADSPFAWIKPMLSGVIEHDGAAFPVLAYILDTDHELRRGLLATRDRLRSDPAEAARYAEVKRAALAAGHTSPWAYQQAKTPYLEALAEQAS